MTRMPNSERFWRNTRNAVDKAESDPKTGPWMKAKRDALKVETTQPSRAPRWRPRNARELRRSHTTGAIRVDPALSRDVGQLMGAMAPKLTKAFDDHLAPLAGEVWAFWPVQSALSKSAVSLEYGISDGGRTFWGSIKLRAPYSLVIKGGPATTLLRRKERDVVTRIATAAIDELARG